MHELAVTQSILEIAKNHAQQAGAEKITDIYLVIGQLSSFIDDSVQFYWDIISQGTMGEGAKLHFERIPAQLKCLSCDTQFTLDRQLTVCPQCASSRIKVLTGDEFRVDSIEVIKDD